MLKILCPDCREPVELDQMVKLDIINTVTHLYCNAILPIKDSGTFKEIALKYPYFSKEVIKRKC